jgi:peptide/nickel transport system substrate-binding protein
LIVALEAAPTHLDPRVGNSQAASRVFEVMLNGLVTKDAVGNLLPDLAASWEILDEGARYRFYLRPDVIFHNGQEFSARDVVWTFQSILDGTVTTPKRGAFERLDRVVEIDEHTVDFVMREPFGAMLVNLTSYMGIIPSGSDPETFNRHPIGTGPFKLVDKKPDQLTFERFEQYWADPAAIEHLIFREIPDSTVRALELRKGSVQLVVNDLAPDVLPWFRENPGYQVIQDPGSKYAYLGFNFNDPLLSRLAVRQAITLAIDRQRLVDTLWQGLGVITETVLPPGNWARNDNLEPIPYDPEAAKALLDEAGLLDPDLDGPEHRFSIVYKTSTDQTALLQAQIIQSMLAEVGIGIEIRSHEFATFFSDIKKGNFQVFSLTWTGILDPDFYSLILHSKSVPPNGANRGRYLNPEFDSLVDAGARVTELEARRPFYLAAQEIFRRDLPYVSLFTKFNFAVMPTQLKGYQNYPSGEFYSLRRVHWERN